MYCWQDLVKEIFNINKDFDLYNLLNKLKYTDYKYRMLSCPRQLMSLPLILKNPCDNSCPVPLKF